MDRRKRAYLAAMGIQLWERRNAAPSGEPAVHAETTAVAEIEPPLPSPPVAEGGSVAQMASAAEKGPEPQAPPVAESGLASPMPSRSESGFEPPTPAVAEDGFEPPPQSELVSDLEPPPLSDSDLRYEPLAWSEDGIPFDEPEPVDARAAAVAAMGWDELGSAVAGCDLCPELVANRSRTVFGVGNRQAEWMVIGEAPGADEDRQGEPFVGRAGQLLNAMLQAIGLPRPQVFIANVLKCRPPNNRDPKPEEAAACRPFLARQIALVAPRIILVVGRVAAQNLLGTDQPIGKLRGREHRHPGIDVPVIVTYHPAYLLRSPGEKRRVWEDLRLARQVYQREKGR